MASFLRSQSWYLREYVGSTLLITMVKKARESVSSMSVPVTPAHSTKKVPRREWSSSTVRNSPSLSSGTARRASWLARSVASWPPYRSSNVSMAFLYPPAVPLIPSTNSFILAVLGVKEERSSNTLYVTSMLVR